MLKRWTIDEANAETPPSPRIRKIIFINISASFVPVPGYIAYSGVSYHRWSFCYSFFNLTNLKLPKLAQRSLADTVRAEATHYSAPKSNYIVQCIFAHAYIAIVFIGEQKTKLELCKRIEGTFATDVASLAKRFPYASQIAPEIIAAVASDDFAVTDKRLDPQLIWTSGIGPSPRRGWGTFDTLLSFLATFVVMPSVRRKRRSYARAMRCGDYTFFTSATRECWCISIFSPVYI